MKTAVNIFRKYNIKQNGKILKKNAVLFLSILCSLAGTEISQEANTSSNLQAIRPPDAFFSFGRGKIRALYLNRHTASSSTPQFKQALEIIENTPLNALVIDMKNVKGDLTYNTRIPEAKHIGASRFSTIKDLSSYVRALKSRGIYLIARIAVFKDRRQARAYPGRAVHTRGGRIWRDRHGEMWVDPFDPAARSYTISIAEEVARMGFDEINFDYIRFPAHRGGLNYDRPDTRSNRVDAIDAFLEEAGKRLHTLGVRVSVDIFGYVLWNRTDMGIGQILEKMSPHVDYICPMLYPSGFYRGSVSFSNPAAHPYEIVRVSLGKGVARGVPASKFRPWLQAFRDYAFSRHQYREHEIAAQIRAAEQMGSSGWFLWNPSSRFPYVSEKLFILTSHPSAEEPSKVTHSAGGSHSKHRRNRRVSPAAPRKKLNGRKDSPLAILKSR